MEVTIKLKRNEVLHLYGCTSYMDACEVTSEIMKRIVAEIKKQEIKSGNIRKAR